MEYYRITGFIRWLVQPHLDPARWWYLPFFLASGGLGLWAMADSGWTDAWPYVVLSVAFLVQVMRPTLLGWWISFLAWTWMGFIDSLYMRVILRRSEYTIGFIFSWGMVPLILMCLIYPRPSHVGRR